MNPGVWATAVGAGRYEFTMQIRRRSVWVATLLTSLIVFTGMKNPWNVGLDTPVAIAVANWAVVCNFLLPVVFGVLLADRWPRDRRLRVSELVEALPASPGGRLVGKVLGGALASALPIFLVYAAGIVFVVARWHDPRAIGTALLAFATVNLPGLLFVAVFSVTVPVLLWVPLYQFLFVGYWFWGNLLSPVYGIPTLSDTMLTPLGTFAASGFFGIQTITGDTAATWQGAASVALLLTGAALALLVAHRYLGWQRARQP